LEIKKKGLLNTELPLRKKRENRLKVKRSNFISNIKHNPRPSMTKDVGEDFWQNMKKSY